MFAIDALGLSRRYGSRWAVREVGFQLPAGKTLAVAGRNGSGKSTLLRILGGALRPHIGEATIAGFSLIGQRSEVRRNVALMSHTPFTYEALTARENLVVVSRYIDGAPEKIDELLAMVGLGTRAEDRVDTFSAGMRKRLMIARTLLQNAPVVLLDEPYSNLDPAGFALVDKLLLRLREEGRTVIIATHQLERVGRLADLAFVLEEGAIAWSGPATGLISDDVQRIVREELAS